MDNVFEIVHSNFKNIQSAQPYCDTKKMEQSLQAIESSCEDFLNVLMKLRVDVTDR